MSRYLAIIIILSIVTSVTPLLLTSSVKAQGYLPQGIPRNEILICENFGGRAADPTNFNIWVLGGTAVGLQCGLHQLCLTAPWYTNYSDGSLILGLAATLPIYNDDYTELTIKFKPGIYWSDGVEFTAEDYVYTLKKAIEDPTHAYHATAVTWIEDVYAKDKYTLVIKLKKPNPYFWLQFDADVWSAWMYPMPKHVFEKVETEGTPWSKYKFFPPVSLGPYILKDYDPSGYWFLWERREDWDRTVVGKFVKEHNLQWVGPKYVLYVAFDTEEQRIAAIARHELDYAFDFTPEGFEVVRSVNPYARSWSLEFPWMFPTEVGIRGIFYNLDKYPYNLTKVRWALTLAINMTDFAITAHKGITKIYPAPIPYIPGTLDLYSKLLPILEDFEITLPNGSKFKPFDPTVPYKIAEWAKKQGLLKEIPPEDKLKMTWGPGWWKYAPDVAEQLLESVGFYRDPDGKWRLPNGEIWHISFKAAGPWEIDATRMAFGIAEQWRRFGIEVEVETLDSSTFWSINHLGYYEVGGWWGAGMETVATWAWPRANEVLHPKYYAPIGNWTSNYIRIKDPKYAEYLDKLMSTPALTPEGKINPEYMDIAIEFIKYRLENMFVTPTQITKKLPIFDSYYWEGFPTEEEGWRAYWDAYFFAGTQWLLPYLRKAPAEEEAVAPPPTQAPAAINWTTIIIVAVLVLIIIGIVIGWIMKRKTART